MKYMHLVVAVFMFSLFGCASAPPPHFREDTTFYLARYDKVWDACIKALAEQGTSVKAADKENGIITTHFMNYSVGPQAHHDIEKIAVKPSAIRLAIWSQVGYTLSIRIIPINDMSTKVRVTAHIEAYDKNVTKQWHKCISYGIIEDTVLQNIRSHL